jgi:hypothetical protein
MECFSQQGRVHDRREAMKNTCAKSRPKERPYEVWKSHDGSWQWHVLKKWQADDTKPYARWFCWVKTPHVPEGELGDVYVHEIKKNAYLIQTDYDEGGDGKTKQT